MSKISCISIVFAFVLAGTSLSMANNLEPAYDVVLRGVNQGMAGGALPPQGTYLSVSSYWANFSRYNSAGNISIRNELNAWYVVPSLLWSTGIKFMEADYAMAITQPFNYMVWSRIHVANQNGSALGVSSGFDQAHWGTSQTLVSPVILSWTLPDNFYAKIGFDFSAKDGSTAPLYGPGNTWSTGTAGGIYGFYYAPSSNGFWSLIPNMAISWLDNGWNISADLHYAVNFKNQELQHKTGDTIYIDYTLTKRITEKWTIGAGFYSKNQITRNIVYPDSILIGSGVDINKNAISYGGGPIASYQFQRVNLQMSFNHSFMTKNDYAGNIYDARFVFPLF